MGPRKTDNSEPGTSSRSGSAMRTSITRQGVSTVDLQATDSTDTSHGTRERRATALAGDGENSLSSARRNAAADEKSPNVNVMHGAILNNKDWDLRVLVEPKIEEQMTESDVIDIVAVHGIGADPTDTWAYRDPGTRVTICNWLTDEAMLRQEAPNARIMQFGYNAQWFGISDKQPTKVFVSEVSERLLRQLDIHRKDSARPLIFIAHSFGGLPVIHALRRSRDDPDKWGNAFRFTAGLVFFGVPFRGRSGPTTQDWEEGVKKNCKTGSSFQIWPETMSTSVPGGQYLEEIFRQWTETRVVDHPIPVSCFWEGLPSPVSKAMGNSDPNLPRHFLVTQGSASLDLSKGVTIDRLERHHYNLQKFEGPHDAEWKSVARRIRRLAEDARPFLEAWATDDQGETPTKTTLKDSQNYVYEELCSMDDAAFNSHANEDIVNCDGQTREKLLEQISEWTDGALNSEHIYWLQGKAGTGKSTIARTVADKLHQAKRLAASYFFKRDEDARRSARYLFTTIAAQLAHNIPAVAVHIQKAIEANRMISTLTWRQQFEELILQPMKAASRGKLRTMTVVIDALDECEEKDIKEIIKLLCQINSTTVPLKLFVTSRYEPSLRLGFQAVQGTKIRQLLLHEIPEDEIKQDIAIFLESRLTKIQHDHEVDDSWPDKSTFQKLLQRSIPLFIFAATACRFIDSPQNSGGPDERLQMILQNETPGDLDGTYQLILDQTVSGLKKSLRRNEIERFKQIVGSIAILANPLNAAALASLLGIGVRHVDDKLKLLHSVLDIPNNASGPVRVFHASFRDYLILRDPEDVHDFSVNEKATHKMLADRCLDLLSKDGEDAYLKKNICGLRSPGESRTTLEQQTIDRCLPSEVQYACLYWVYHLERIGDTLDDEHRVLRFLRTHFLHWLEALSLIDKISESIRFIGGLKSLVDCDRNPSLSRFLHDAKRFILQNRQTADDAPLQLYYSGLIFAPRSVVISAVFGEEPPAWKYRLPEVEDNSSAAVQILGSYDLPVSSVAFSPDSLTLASGSMDGTVRLWDTGTGYLKNCLCEHLGPVTSLAFSPRDRLLASGSEDETVRLWDSMTGEELESFITDSALVELDPPLPFTHGPDDSVVPFESCGASFQKSLWGFEHTVTSVAFSHDGQMLAVAFTPVHFNSLRNERPVGIQVWDTESKKEICYLEGHSQYIGSVAFPSCNSPILASGSRDGTVRIWNTTTGEASHKIEHHLTNRGVRSPVWSVAFKPGTQILAYGSDNGAVLWDTARNKEIHILGDRKFDNSGHHSIQSLAFSPDGQILASGSLYGMLRLWDTTTGNLQRNIELFSPPLSLAFSPNGQLLACGSLDGVVRLLDPAINAPNQTPKRHSAQILSLAFSPNGQLLASESIDKTIRLWDTETGELRKTWQVKDVIPSGVGFSRDGLSIQIINESLEARSFYRSDSFYGKQTDPEISLNEQWIKLKNQRVLWLPPHLRPCANAVAIFDSAVALGHASGHISFIDFDPVEV